MQHQNIFRAGLELKPSASQFHLNCVIKELAHVTVIAATKLFKLLLHGVGTINKIKDREKKSSYSSKTEENFIKGTLPTALCFNLLSAFSF